MNFKVLIVIVFISVIIIGLIKKMYTIIKYVDNLKFSNEYVSKLYDLLNKKIDNDGYNFILKNATKLSEVLGSYGVINFKPPFANYIYKNYSIVNTILNYNDELMNDELVMAIKMIHIYLGACDNVVKKIKKQLRNPLLLFAEGFRFVFDIPLFTLNSLGIISTKVYHKIKGNVLYYFIQNIFALISITSSIIGIIQGKEVVIEIYIKIVKFVTSIF